MRIVNDLGFVEAWVNVLKNQIHQVIGFRSATELTNPPRMVELFRRHKDDDRMVIYLSKRLWAIFGSAVHTILEYSTQQSNTYREQIFTVPVDGHVVSMKPDWLELLPDSELTDAERAMLAKLGAKTGHHCVDFKVPKVYVGQKWAEDPQQSWIAQANVYAALARRLQIYIVRARVEAIYKDWAVSDLKRTKSYYPPKAGQVLCMPLWPIEQQDTYLKQRIALHSASVSTPDDQLPFCTAEERWATAPEWKVRKKGGDRALPGGVCASKEQADTFARSKEYPTEIQFCPGVQKRCEEWCDAAAFCNQFAMIKSGIEVD